MGTEYIPESVRRAVTTAALVGAVCALVLGVAVGHAAPPANDAIAAAQVIQGPSGLLVATNAEATVEPGEPDHGGEHSVWYRWTAPETARVAFETCNASGAPTTTFDTVLAVYVGATAAELRRVARNDDSCGTQSRVQFQASAGATYHVVVAGYEDESGRFALRWRQVLAPANDAFAAAQRLAGARGRVAATTVGATLEPGEPVHGRSSTASVWYTWTSPITAALAFETCGSSFDTLLAVYTGDSLGGLRRIAQNDDGCGIGSRVPVDARAGTTYHIAVAGFDASGDFTLGWIRRPGNDEIANARALRGARGALSASSAGATREPGEPPRQRGASVWYRWRAPSPAPVAFSTCTASFDTILFLYRRTPAGRRSFLRSNDDGCPRGLGSLVVLHPDRGATYEIAVDGLGGATGSFRLVWGPPPPSAWCVVPDVRGETLREATTALRNANCALGRVVRVPSTIVPRGVVVSQFPLASSTRRRFGTQVNLEVSRGPG